MQSSTHCLDPATLSPNSSCPPTRIFYRKKSCAGHPTSTRLLPRPSDITPALAPLALSPLPLSQPTHHTRSKSRSRTRCATTSTSTIELLLAHPLTLPHATTALQKCDESRQAFMQHGQALFVSGYGLEEQWKVAMAAKARLCESQLDLMAIWLPFINDQMRTTPDALKESTSYETLADHRKNLQTLEIQSRRELVTVWMMQSPIDAGTALHAERARSQTVAQTCSHGLTRHLEYLDAVNHPLARSAFTPVLTGLANTENDPNPFRSTARHSPRLTLDLI